MSRNAKFSDQKDVEGNAKPLRDFVGNRYAAAGKGENGDVGTTCVFLQALGEQPPCIKTICETHEAHSISCSA